MRLYVKEVSDESNELKVKAEKEVRFPTQTTVDVLGLLFRQLLLCTSHKLLGFEAKGSQKV